MEFRILGPAEVVAEGRSLELGGERPHALLALLLLNRNKVVAVDVLIDSLWGERPPATAAKTLQVYVSRLRKLLSPQRLVTRPPGYMLVVDDEELDLARFESLVADARTGEPRFAASRLREALTLFRGPPLADLGHLDFAAAEARRIEELRLAALEDRIDAELALGEHGRLIGELESLVVENPFRERLRAQLMLALYRSGRQAEALDAYQRTRRELVEELGIEPGPSLQALERAILHQDAALGPAARRTERPEAPRAERKVVTAVFVDMVGFTARTEQLDPEDVQALLSPYYARVRSELERFGGTVEKFIGDAVMALFGVPVAREDDAERAVRAALAVREAVSDLNQETPQRALEIRIGINSGVALVTIGGDTGEPRAVGDVINTAARLEAAAAPDAILVGETTYRASRDAIEYREAEPAVAKGKLAPVVAWEAIGPKALTTDSFGRLEAVQLVGRHGELALLRDALARSRHEREAQLVTVVGPPGIGKSRLVRELGRMTERDADSPLWLHGRCLPYGDGITFSAVSEVVKAYAGILETDSAASTAGKLRRALHGSVSDAREARTIETHVRRLLGLEHDDSREEPRVASFAAWRRFFEAVAELRPLVLAFEDLHWADDAFLDFVDELVEWAQTAPLLVLCTARPELLDRRPMWAGGKRNATTISLNPLGEQETTTLLAALVGESRVPLELESSLVRRSGGVPLYAEEYVRMLVDRGYLKRRGAGVTLEREDALPLPESIQAILAARLDLLPPDEKDLLGDAAVVGTVFWAGALATSSAAPRSLVEDRLRRLERKDLVRRRRHTSVAGETEYAFRHVLVRDAAYAQLPRARRHDRHRLVAQWMESIGADRDDKIELLAHHYLQAVTYARAAGKSAADLVDQARLLLREAGARASALNAPRSAAQFLASALELWPAGDGGRPRLLLELGRARVFAEMAGSEDLRAARSSALKAHDPETAAEAQVWLGHLAWAHGDHAACLAHLESAHELVERRPASPTKALVLDQLARRHMTAANVEAAFRFARSALRIYEKLGDEEGRAEILSTIGVARASAGDRAGLADLEESIAIARAHALPQALARACLNLAYLLSVYGDIARVTGLHDEGRAAALRAGDAPLLGYYRGVEVLDAFARGRYEEARALCDAFLAQSEATPHHQEHLFRLVRAEVALSRGEDERASADARRAIEFARAVREPQALYLALGWGARILSGAGCLDEARGYAEEVLDRWIQHGRAFAPSAWVLGAAFVLGPSEELERALAGAPTSTVWLQAARSVASADWTHAAELLAAISRPSEAYARTRGAEQLLAEGRWEEAALELEHALAFYRRVGASADAERAESLTTLRPSLARSTST